MKLNTGFIYFNIAYGAALVSFLFLYYFNIKNIFITNFIFIMALTLLLIKLLYWYSISKDRDKKVNDLKKQKYFFLRLTYCVLAYISPAYCIMQEASLVVSHFISSITLTIVIILAIIGILMERLLFVTESKYQINIKNGKNVI